MVWKKRDPRSFLSCGKDNLLVQHTFNDATHPAKHANPVGLAIDIRGNIALARSDKRIESLSSSYAASLTASSNQVEPIFIHQSDVGSCVTAVTVSLLCTMEIQSSCTCSCEH